ncbi:MAG: diaminopimelate epimerase [Candidatus Dormibacteria bacterium]
MILSFHKIQGAGNDFIVVNEPTSPAADWPVLARRLCDRHRGIGADGILLVGPSQVADLRMRLFNADGSEAEMCGNGVRCTAKYALDSGLAPGPELTWETGAGPVSTVVTSNHGTSARVRVDMGLPRLRPAEIPVTATGEAVLEGAFEVAGGSIELTCVSMGNPHAVAFVTSVADFPLERIGPEIEHSVRFPRRTNFEIVEVVSPEHYRVRVWERGVGETQACGTGACAVAVAARLVRNAPEVLQVELPGGCLEISWERGQSVFMTGPADVVFAGEVEV